MSNDVIGLPYIFFIYGLALYTSGFILLFQSFRISTTGLGTNVKYLGYFFILHGIANWNPIFRETHQSLFTQNLLVFLDIGQDVLIIISYYYLFLYGLKLLLPDKINKKLKLIFYILFACWLFSSVFFFLTNNFNIWYTGSRIAANYLIGLPGAFMTAFGLKKYGKVVDKLFIDIRKYFNYVFYTFIIYGLSFLVSYQEPFFPANVINFSSFLKYTGIPIQTFRALFAIIIAASLVKITNDIHKAISKKYEEMHRQTIISEERERISQDIHDGTLQALFGLGLRIQKIEKLIKKGELETAQDLLQQIKIKIDETSREIRSYIIDIANDNSDSDFIKEIKKIIDDFIMESGINVNFNYKKIYNYLFPPNLTLQLTFIIKEALNNVRKHAKASIIQITIVISQGKLELVISDNGKGFDPTAFCNSSQHLGIKSMHARVKSLGGLIKINSQTGEGTEIIIIIPLVH